MDKMKNTRNIFMLVYVAVAIATFRHSAFAFASIEGVKPDALVPLIFWWLIGALGAAAVDIGMAAIVISLLSGHQAKWLVWALFVLAGFSAYTQLVFSAHKAVDYPLGQVAQWLAWLEYVLDARVVLLPLVLPLFALIYAMAAKGQKAAPASIDSALLAHIEAGQLNQSDIARQFEVSPSTVSRRVKELVETGVINKNGAGYEVVKEK